MTAAIPTPSVERKHTETPISQPYIHLRHARIFLVDIFEKKKNFLLPLPLQRHLSEENLHKHLNTNLVTFRSVCLKKIKNSVTLYGSYS